MKSKILIQFILAITAIIIFFIFYFKYFNNPDSNIKKKQESQILSIENKNEKDVGNTVKNIKYESTDSEGNVYLIQSDLGEFKDEDKDVIFMTTVRATIIFTNTEKINLTSKNARYNTINNDTYFINDVKLDYLDHKVDANNIDIFFKDSKLEAYNNLYYRNLDLKLLADKIEIDFLTKDSKIYMFDEKKIKILKNNNGNN
tara:strand:- start:5504 stop:6106 length:603 start_codon:yes stop_codon:yes gene_type:complete